MNRKIFAVAAMMLLMPMMMGAQALKGSYFLDNSLTRNKMNPAFAPNTGYWQIPVIGNFNIGLFSNLQVQDFIYPIDGQLYTFLNKNVTVKQFDKRLAKNPYLDIASEFNIVNFGFFTGKSFWSVDMGLRINADIDVPSDLFLFMKRGSGSEGFYNIGAIKANVAASAVASVGWSRDFYEYLPGLRVGARARAILPVGYAGLNLNDVSLTTSQEKWVINAEGAVHTAVKGLNLADSEGNLSPSFDASQLGLPGFGFSFDLGAEYKMEFEDFFINGVEFSASMTDLGLINYGANAVKAFTTRGNMEWTGLDISLEEGAMNGVMDGLKDDVMNLINLQEEKQGRSMTRSSMPSVYLGAEMPFLNRMMSIGALYSARTSYKHVRNELTLSYNLIPTKWFQMGLNYSFLNVSKTLGWMLELTPRVGPGFYIGSDYTFLSMARMPDNFALPVLPMSMRFNLHFGLSVALGGRTKKA